MIRNVLLMKKMEEGAVLPQEIFHLFGTRRYELDYIFHA